MGVNLAPYRLLRDRSRYIAKTLFKPNKEPCCDQHAARVCKKCLKKLQKLEESKVSSDESSTDESSSDESVIDLTGN